MCCLVCEGYEARFLSSPYPTALFLPYLIRVFVLFLLGLPLSSRLKSAVLFRFSRFASSVLLLWFKELSSLCFSFKAALLFSFQGTSRFMRTIALHTFFASATVILSLRFREVKGFFNASSISPDELHSAGLFPLILRPFPEA